MSYNPFADDAADRNWSRGERLTVGNHDRVIVEEDGENVILVDVDDYSRTFSYKRHDFNLRDKHDEIERRDE